MVTLYASPDNVSNNQASSVAQTKANSDLDIEPVTAIYRNFVALMKSAYIEQGGGGWGHYLLGQILSKMNMEHTSYISLFGKQRQELAIKLCEMHHGQFTKENFKKELDSLPDLYEQEPIALAMLKSKIMDDLKLKKIQMVASGESDDFITEKDINEMKAGISSEEEVWKTNINKFQFATDYIDSLGDFYQSFVRIQDFQNGKTKNLVQSLYEANNDLNVAKVRLSFYKNADNKYIRKWINTLCDYFDKLVEVHLQSIKLLNAMSDPKTAANYDRGTINDLLAQSGAKTNAILEAIGYLSGEPTYILLRPVSDKSMKMNVIDLTRSERDDLIKKIDGVFGDEVQHGIQNVQNTKVFPAALLREFLTKDFMSKNEA